MRNRLCSRSASSSRSSRGASGYESIPTGGWDGVSGDSVGTKEVPRHLVRHGGMVVVRVNGMSMYPKIMDGDLVLVDTPRTKPRSGEAIAAVYRGETTLKR